MYLPALRTRWAGLFCVLGLVLCVPASAIEIVFDYRYDTQNLFAAPALRAALDEAASLFEVFTDQLAPIPSSQVTAWNARFSDPSSTGIITQPGEAIAADTVVIYVGGYDLDGTSLARGTVGAFSSTTDTALQTLLRTRGQVNAWGASPTDFGRWGGVISFDTTLTTGEPRTWSTGPPQAGAIDLQSIAMHEIAHVLGFNSSTNPAYPTSFQTHVDLVNSVFTGPNAVKVYGRPVPVETLGSAHWGEGVTSEANGKTLPALMVSTIGAGMQRTLTTLDYAAMADIGWEVPEGLFAAQVAGDYDQNGVYNGGDLAVWKANFGARGDNVSDGNHDGIVDAADFTVWRDALALYQFDAPDANADGAINTLDRSAWLGTFNSISSLLADSSGNGIVDAADYTLWRDRVGALSTSTNNVADATLGFTTGISSSTDAVFATPEPASGLLAFLLGLVVLFVGHFQQKNRWISIGSRSV